MHNKNILLNLIGWFLVLLGIFNAYIHITTDNGLFLLWYCNHISILGGILILLRKRSWLNAVINVGLIPVLFWIADYFSNSMFNYNLFGFVGYVFAEKNPFLFFLYLQHIYVIPLMIFALYLLGGAMKNAWKNSTIYGVFLFGIGWFFDPAYNMNCSRKLCVSFFPNNLLFLVVQYLIMIGFGFLSNWILWKTMQKTNS
jgi:hypothetical protein